MTGSVTTLPFKIGRAPHNPERNARTRAAMDFLGPEISEANHLFGSDAVCEALGSWWVGRLLAGLSPAKVEEIIRDTAAAIPAIARLRASGEGK